MKTFLVGGAVRDELLGCIPKDKDYVIVGASTYDIQGLVDSGYQQVGADFPVYLHPITKAEYALARTERKSGSGYLGFEVDTQGVTLEQDLFRRDITISSMAKDLETGEIIDPYGGMEDLKNKIIRHTSDAFIEDPLRIIRVCRFAARYDFTIHPSTVELCEANRYKLTEISKERIFLEMLKACGDTHHQKFFIYLDGLGISEVLFDSSQFSNTATGGFHNKKLLLITPQIILASYFIKFKAQGCFFTNVRSITRLKTTNRFNNDVYSLIHGYVNFTNRLETFKNIENNLLTSPELLFEFYSNISKGFGHGMMLLYIHGRNSPEYMLYKLMKKIDLELKRIKWDNILFLDGVALYNKDVLPQFVKSYKIEKISNIIK